MKVFAGTEITPLHIMLSRFGEVRCSPRWNSKTGYPRSPSSRIYFMEEGCGYLKTETQHIQMEPGYAYLIPSNLYHEYGCSGLKKFYFQFSIRSKGSKDILSAVGKICQMRYDPEDFQALLACYKKNDCISALQMRLLLAKNIIRILQENDIPTPSLNPHSELVNKAISYIESEAFANLTVQTICNQLFVSESKLRAAFYAEVGISIGRYIDNRVMAKAQQLLKNSNLSIGEIGTALGFCDQFYLSRQFKKHFGITPSEYRKSLKEPQP